MFQVSAHLKGVHEGLVKTAKSNFGGGNTAWEEKKLKGFAASETRLIEIIESICSSDKFCSMFLESQEETIENWWFDNADLLRTSSITEEGATKISVDFEDFLCVSKTAVCCPSNTYGPKCEACPTEVAGETCSGNGKCDGDGTRSGTGKCSCSQGYIGDECSHCDDAYYLVPSENSSIICTACESHCNHCDAAGPGQCFKCNSGFLLTKAADNGAAEVGSCVDIDECAAEEGSPCTALSTYCINIPGSHRCMSCDSACDSAGCSGAGPGACIGDCTTGYRKSSTDRCEDIDECSEADAAGPKLCGDPKPDALAAPVCINSPGSYRCGCSQEGFEYGEGVCIPVPPKVDEAAAKNEESLEAEGKKKYTEKRKREEVKPATNKAPSGSNSKKVASSLETDFSLLHFCAMLAICILVISFLASKPRPWPAVAGVLMVLTAAYVYYYVGQH